MICNTKKLVLATIALGFVATSLTTPAEAKRYRNAATRAVTGYTVPAQHLGGSNVFGPMMASGGMWAPQAQPTRYRRGGQAAYRPHAYRRSVYRAAGYRHVANRHVVNHRSGYRAAGYGYAAAPRVTYRQATYRHAYHGHFGRRGAQQVVRYSAPRMSRTARSAYGALPPAASASMPSFGGGSSLVAQARRYIGTNPTGMSALWCARFMNMVLERSGRRGTGSNMANSFARYGTRVSGPQVGAIAVMSRGRGGGHVGIVSGIDSRGNPIIISGNYNRRVAEAPISRSRIYAYVMP